MQIREKVTAALKFLIINGKKVHKSEIMSISFLYIFFYAYYNYDKVSKRREIYAQKMETKMLCLAA